MEHRQEYHQLTVAEVVDETPDTKSFVLDIPPSLDAAFSYAAGQFCTFRATIDGEPVVRCYSMSSAPEVDERFTTTVKRVPDGRMSNWMNDALGPADAIDVMPPTGLFVLHERDDPIVAFAGGSGITPVISIIKSALATTTRPITLVYANRNRESVIFAGAIAQMAAASNGQLVVHEHLDDERGFLDPAACAALAKGSEHGDVYVCGPKPYMDTVEAGLEQVGAAPERTFIERFVLPGDVPDDEAPSATERLVFRLGRRKQEVAYRAGETILEAARRGGLSPPFSCESGSCATCIARLTEGTAKMRANNALTPEEVDDGWVLTCQSIPEGQTVAVDYHQ